MNREDIIRMAQETGVTAERVRDLVNFAKLVAQHEREACAKVVDAAKANEKDWDSNDWNQAVEFCVARIRARGQA
jgi:hypothetical protein